MDIQTAASKIKATQEQIEKVLLGQQDVVEHFLVCLFAGGHVLLEGVPGLGKTLLARTMASCFQGEFRRIQFTPDLMPADVTGHAMYDQKEGEFKIRRGPIFTNLLLADEINRAPAKTQSALLEVMQEKQITIEGRSLSAKLPFMVLATQNPIEHEGTYPLPEAELDRFLMKLFIDYPEHQDEMQIVKAITTNTSSDVFSLDDIEAVLTPEEVLAIQTLGSNIEVDDEIVDYVVRLVTATRQHTGIRQGAGPRASIGIIRAARIFALMKGNDFVLPDDVKAMALPVMRHRIQLSADLEIDGMRPDDVLRQILDTVEAPRR